jgi:hypothetical protein
MPLPYAGAFHFRPVPQTHRAFLKAFVLSSLIGTPEQNTSWDGSLPVR